MSKKVNVSGKFDELPYEVVLVVCNFILDDRKSILNLSYTSKKFGFYDNKDTMWKQLCYQHCKKKISRDRVDHMKSMYKDGYMEMFLCSNVKRYNKFSIINILDIENAEKVKEFDSKNGTNLEKQMIQQAIDHGTADGKIITLNDAYEKLWDDEPPVIYIFGVLKKKLYKMDFSDMFELINKKKLHENLNKHYDVFYFSYFMEGGNAFGTFFRNNDMKEFANYWDGQVCYGEKRILFASMFTILFGEYGDAVEETEKFENMAKLRNNKKKRKITFLKDIRSLLPDHVKKYDVKKDAKIFFLDY